MKGFRLCRCKESDSENNVTLNYQPLKIFNLMSLSIINSDTKDAAKKARFDAAVKRSRDKKTFSTGGKSVFKEGVRFSIVGTGYELFQNETDRDKDRDATPCFYCVLEKDTKGTRYPLYLPTLDKSAKDTNGNDIQSQAYFNRWLRLAQVACNSLTDEETEKFFSDYCKDKMFSISRTIVSTIYGYDKQLIGVCIDGKDYDAEVPESEYTPAPAPAPAPTSRRRTR